MLVVVVFDIVIIIGTHVAAALRLMSALFTMRKCWKQCAMTLCICVYMYMSCIYSSQTHELKCLIKKIQIAQTVLTILSLKCC